MLTYEEEMDLKYGISDKMSRVHDWEIETIVEKMILEHAGCVIGNSIYTGFNDLDKAIGGLHRGQTYLLAGRPSMGKTSFAVSLLSNLAKESNKKVLYISLENSREWLIRRLLKAISVNKACSDCCYSEENFQVNMESAGRLLSEFGKSLFIDDRPGISMDEISGDCSELGEIDLIVVDYLQLVNEPDYNDITPMERWSLCCEDLRLLAKEHDCPILILSQLSRAVETRRDHRPGIEDVTRLVPGRSVDNVIFLYRDEYYYRDSMDKGIAEFYLAKRKEGGSSQMLVNLGWNAEKCVFTNIL